MLKVLLRVFGVVAYELSTCTSENLPLKVIKNPATPSSLIPRERRTGLNEVRLDLAALQNQQSASCLCGSRLHIMLFDMSFSLSLGDR